MRKVNEIAQGKRVYYYCLSWTIIREEHDNRILCLTRGQVCFRHAKRKPVFFLLVRKPWFGESTGRHQTVIRCAGGCCSHQTLLDGGGKAKGIKASISMACTARASAHWTPSL